MSFVELNLHSKILQAMSACGFQAPTEIQRQAIPVALSGRDLMASAQTGTGKTAAFVLPILHRCLTSPVGGGKGPRALILTPTRELAMQVNQNIRQLGRFAQLLTGDVVGGMPYPPQMRLLRQALDIVVATPGRLMDHMEAGRVNFSRLEILVLDEADRMLDMGFRDAVKSIVAATPAARQTLLFSATLEGKVLDIARELLKNPERIQLAHSRERHASIEQRVYAADDVAHKHRLLAHHLANTALSQAVIFTATKRGADQLAQTLVGLGHPSAALHGDMNQRQRKRTVDHMRRGALRLLVATDVAARGLDIKGISHVINFDLPMVAEDYVHRIGRTGRGGATGIAISLVTPEDRWKLNGIERLLERRFTRDVIPGLEPRRPERPPSRGPSKRHARPSSAPGRRAKPSGAARPAATSGRFRPDRPAPRPGSGSKQRRARPAGGERG